MCCCTLLLSKSTLCGNIIRMNNLKKKNITIVGLGLMGGSYAKALRRAGFANIFAIDLDMSTLTQSQSDGIITKGYLDPADILPSSDILIISLYPKQTIEFMEENYTNFKKDSLVIDICGVKSVVTDNLPKRMLDRCDFVPTHPMAGREKKGYQMSTEDLFDGCSYVITPLDSNKAENIDIVRAIASDIGAKRVLTCDPRTHDEYISFVSQLPHVLACSYMASSGHRPLSEYAAGSFRDVSRVALINELVWQELFSLNREFLTEEIDSLITELHSFRDIIASDDKQGAIDYMKSARIIKEDYDSRS